MTAVDFEAIQNFHEIWWIYSDQQEEWAGLRLAHFRKASPDVLIVIITSEIDQRRVGVRIWDDIKDREGWHKIMQVPIPTTAEIREALAR